MHIQSIAAENLKGQTFTHTLTPRTIIAGPNFAGKTAIADAVRLALMGKLPEMGGKPGDAFGLASGSRMQVAATIAQSDTDAMKADVIVERTLQQKGGSITCTPAKIDPEYACPMLEPDAWFAMTERERIDYVFKNVTMPSDSTPAGILARLQRLTFGEEHSEAIEEAKAATIDSVRSIIADDEVADLPAALVEAEEELAADFTLWNGRAKDSEGAIRTLTELKLREDECSAATLVDLRNDESRLTGLVDEANRTLGKLTEQQQAAAAAERRRREIEFALTETVPTPRQIPTFKASIDIGKVASAITHGKKTLEGLAVVDVDAAQEAYNVAIDALGKATGNQQQAAAAVADSEEQLADLENHKECPFCKSKAKGWDARVRAAIEEPLKAAREKLTAANLALTSATEARDKARSELMAVTARQQARQQTEKNVRDLKAQLQQNETAVAAYEREVENVKALNASNVANYNNRLKALREELARLPETPENVTATLEDAHNEMTTHATALAAAKAKVREAEKLAHDLKRGTQAAEEATKAAARRDVIKAIKAELTEVKGGLVATAFKSLLETANAIVGDILKAPLAYDAATSQVGMWTPTGFVSHKSFSGTEKVLTYLAISAALSAKAKLKVAIIDELARLTDRVRALVLIRLDFAVTRGILDQVIAIVPCDGPMRGGESAWSVINVGGAK